MSFSGLTSIHSLASDLTVLSLDIGVLSTLRVDTSNRLAPALKASFLTWVRAAEYGTFSTWEIRVIKFPFSPDLKSVQSPESKLT